MYVWKVWKVGDEQNCKYIVAYNFDEALKIGRFYNKNYNCAQIVEDINE